mmetsp:Transcript_11916/g.35674  ORF Transcript_11916/g.35674 Transcript_11916/m.35674 type:complete len:1710 (+) Transcript_11916:506-5635(+)
MAVQHLQGGARETAADVRSPVHRCGSAALCCGPPTQIVTLLMDGPAPMAKLLTQRRRRVKSVRREGYIGVDGDIESADDSDYAAETEDSEADTDSDEDTDGDAAGRSGGAGANAHHVSEGGASRSSPFVNGALSRLALTPGTPFMLKLEQALHYWIAQQLVSSGYRKLKFEIDGATIPGEGEVKLFYRIAHPWPIPDGAAAGESHIAIGGDSDMKLLAMLGEGPVDGLVSSFRPTRKGSVLHVAQMTDTKAKSKWANNVEGFHGCFDVGGMMALLADLPVGRHSLPRDIATDLAALVIMQAGNDYLPAISLPFSSPAHIGATFSNPGMTNIWRAYLTARMQPQFHKRCLIKYDDSPELSLDSQLLSAVLQELGAPDPISLHMAVAHQQYAADAAAEEALAERKRKGLPLESDEEVPGRIHNHQLAADGSPEANGLQYLQGVLWLIDMYRRGMCGDYQYHYDCHPPRGQELLAVLAVGTVRWRPPDTDLAAPSGDASADKVDAQPGTGASMNTPSTDAPQATEAASTPSPDRSPVPATPSSDKLSQQAVTEQRSEASPPTVTCEHSSQQEDAPGENGSQSGSCTTAAEDKPEPQTAAAQWLARRKAAEAAKSQSVSGGGAEGVVGQAAQTLRRPDPPGTAVVPGSAGKRTPAAAAAGTAQHSARDTAHIVPLNHGSIKAAPHPSPATRPLLPAACGLAMLPGGTALDAFVLPPLLPLVEPKSVIGDLFAMCDTCDAMRGATKRLAKASAFLTECNKRLDAAARPANSANPSRAASAPADVSQPPQTAATSAVGRTTVIRKYVGTAPAGGSPPSTGWGTSNPAGGGSAASAVASPGAGGLRAADLKQAQAGALATAAHIQLLMADLASAGHVSTEELDEAAVRAVAMAGNTSSSSAMDPEISAARELLLDPSARLKSAHKQMQTAHQRHKASAHPYRPFPFRALEQAVEAVPREDLVACSGKPLIEFGCPVRYRSQKSGGGIPRSEPRVVPPPPTRRFRPLTKQQLTSCSVVKDIWPAGEYPVLGANSHVGVLIPLPRQPGQTNLRTGSPPNRPSGRTDDSSYRGNAIADARIANPADGTGLASEAQGREGDSSFSGGGIGRGTVGGRGTGHGRGRSTAEGKKEGTGTSLGSFAPQSPDSDLLGVYSTDSARGRGRGAPIETEADLPEKADLFEEVELSQPGVPRTPRALQGSPGPAIIGSNSNADSVPIAETLEKASLPLAPSDRVPPSPVPSDGVPQALQDRQERPSPDRSPSSVPPGNGSEAHSASAAEESRPVGAPNKAYLVPRIPRAVKGNEDGTSRGDSPPQRASTGVEGNPRRGGLPPQRAVTGVQDGPRSGGYPPQRVSMGVEDGTRRGGFPPQRALMGSEDGPPKGGYQRATKYGSTVRSGFNNARMQDNAPSSQKSAIYGSTARSGFNRARTQQPPFSNVDDSDEESDEEDGEDFPRRPRYPRQQPIRGTAGARLQAGGKVPAVVPTPTSEGPPVPQPLRKKVDLRAAEELAADLFGTGKGSGRPAKSKKTARKKNGKGRQSDPDVAAEAFSGGLCRISGGSLGGSNLLQGSFALPFAGSSLRPTSYSPRFGSSAAVTSVNAFGDANLVNITFTSAVLRGNTSLRPLNSRNAGRHCERRGVCFATVTDVDSAQLKPELSALHRQTPLIQHMGGRLLHPRAQEAEPARRSVGVSAPLRKPQRNTSLVRAVAIRPTAVNLVLV